MTFLITPPTIQFLELRRADEIIAAAIPKSAAQIVVETKIERELKLRDTTIDSLAGGVATNFFTLLAEEQVSLPIILLTTHFLYTEYWAHLRTECLQFVSELFKPKKSLAFFWIYFCTFMYNLTHRNFFYCF